MTEIRLARAAMATRFELLLEGEDAVSLRAAGEEALHEVERVEAQLSFYRRESELSGLNARGAAGWVKLDPRFFRLLERARDLSAATRGAFDPTVAPLVRCWGFAGEGGRVPGDEELEAARAAVGFGHVRFDEESFSVRFDGEGVALDLGAIGKGYALERAAMLLREAGVGAALLHAGTSSVYGLGAPAGRPGWPVGIRDPDRPDSLAARVALCDRALGVSAPHGKFFEAGATRYGHVLDPRSGSPVMAARLSAVVSDSPTEADALSTALLVLGAPGLPLISEHHPGAAGMVISGDPQGPSSVAAAGGVWMVSG